MNRLLRAVMGSGMHCGIDYGTSNSSLGVVKDGKVVQAKLEQESVYLPSAIYRAFPEHELNDDIESRTIRQQLGNAQGMLYGTEAIEAYIRNPGEGLFMKSPKVFLGSDLNKDQLDFFQVVIAKMMLHILEQARAFYGHDLTQAVVGRPIRYHGIRGEQGDKQALAIMQHAAAEAGLDEIVFMYEPLAAALDYEQGLSGDEVLLVVDVGGGTTDCSVVKVGPSYRQKRERSDDLLAYAGNRIGGVDLDINLGWHSIMPLFGRGTDALHNKAFDAIAVNSIPSQQAFYSRFEMPVHGKADAVRERLYKVWLDKLSSHLVRSAELAKIALSDAERHEFGLDYVEQDLQVQVRREDFREAIERSTEKIRQVIDDARQASTSTIDKIYLTGGSAVSPVIQQVIRNVVGDAVPFVSGNMHGSVACGLSVFASRHFSG
ncbi:molecular chaperone [Methylobacillus arboreus]|uniref:molecular chaperone n=1 Tax=Methylobacillus arboreus TaxID=755170 RepID=UPI001E537F60|nr:molecular chaperone [Methylobacillus arboreus]MCB5191826.1 molecular chaperone [Methylobacillus arboreus]